MEWINNAWRKKQFKYKKKKVNKTKTITQR